MDTLLFPADLKLPSGMTHFELPTGDYPLDFWGRFIHEVNTDDGERSRWAHLVLYKIIDTNPEHDSSLNDENKDMYGKEMYLLYTIGHTLVYHRENASCRGGIKVKVSEFSRKTADFPQTEDDPDLEPCEKCSPGDYHLASPDDVMRLEVTWYSNTPCQSAAKLIRSLSKCGTCHHKLHDGRRCFCGCSTDRDGILTSPGRQLLDEVRDSEPEIARAMTMKKRL